MRFTINLATRTYLDHSLLNKYTYIIVAILLGITAWNISKVTSNMGEQSRLNTEITTIQNRLGIKPGDVSAGEFASQKEHIRFYNGIIERKSTDWLKTLDLIENATPVGIALSALSPGKNQGDWKIEGRTKSFKTVQQYLEKLESSQGITNVLLLSHQNIVAGDKARGVQFVISCKVTE